MAEIEIKLNGESQLVSATTVCSLVRDLGLGEKQIAIERNGAIVPRSVYADTHLEVGDRIEIVHCVAGG